MKKRKRFRKRRIALFLFLVVIGCNASGVADMRSSKSTLEKEFAEAKIKHYKVKTLNKNGREIFFAQATNLEKMDSLPVFIFAHGTPGALSNSMAYLKDSTLLQKGIVVAYDRPGFGYSEYGKATTTLSDQAKVLKILMDEYEGHEIYLIGHSYGAPVILQAALDYPEKVKGLVWLGGIVQEAWKANAWWRKPMKYPPISWLVPVSMKVSNVEIIGLDPSLELIKNRWKEVTCPIVMIQGEEDWLAAPSNTIYADSMLTNTSYKKTILVPGKSHFFYFSETNYIVDALSGMMD